MKKLRIGTLTCLLILSALFLMGCEQAMTHKDVTEQAISILESLRGAASSMPHEEGQFSGPLFTSVDSFYIDDTVYGIRSVGWVYWDDNDTPADTLDDTFTFIGMKEYLDWNFSEDWFFDA